MSAPPLETKEDKVTRLGVGFQPEEIKILSDPVEIRHWYLDLINSAKSEISLIIATPNALRRNLSGGMINLLRDAAEKKNVKVKLIVPAYEDHIHKAEDSFQRIGLMPTIRNFQIKTILPMTRRTNQIKSTFLIVDRQTSFIIDVKDDTRENLIDAVGFASYYRSKIRTESYSYIFDTVWRQADLYESLAQANKSLKEAYKKLELHDAMEKEFINIAAHELRTPAQAIIGYAEMLKSFPERRQQYEEAISRNAVRLYALVTDMLDVARIESQTFKIERTSFDLNTKVENVIKDIRQQMRTESHRKVRILFEPSKPIPIFADKARMFQVFANLLNNALKFTTDGTVVVSTNRKDETNEAIITIKDSGNGIDPEILPHLFSKFKTKSDKGVGLGLYIAKNIVEAHGGTIDAYNNTDGKGATFSVKIPLKVSD
jgi:two-component system, OmpR family, sensor histidine kinase VicK